MRLLVLILGVILAVAGAFALLFGVVIGIGAMNLNPEYLRGAYISNGLSFGIGGLVLGVFGALIAYLSRAPSPD